MSGASDPNLPGGWEAAAAEYVLGLLSDEEVRAFEAQLSQNRDLRQDVEAWEEYFAALTDPVEDVAPPPQVLRRIEGQLFGRPRRNLLRQLVPYLVGAVAAAAIAWAAMLGGLLQFGEPEPHLYADLVQEDGELQLLAHYAPDSSTFMVRHDDGQVPEGRVLEIWLISAPDAAPISLGLVQPNELTQIPLSPELEALMPGATVALSEEPPGGSPTGAPTGPVIALAQLGER